jgi:hypothetical protein
MNRAYKNAVILSEAKNLSIDFDFFPTSIARPFASLRVTNFGDALSYQNFVGVALDRGLRTSYYARSRAVSERWLSGRKRRFAKPL